jgi:hypothetical protein
MGRSGALRHALRASLPAVLGVVLATPSLRAQQDTSLTPLVLQVAVDGGPARVVEAFARDSLVLLPVRAMLDLMGIGATASRGGARLDAVLPPNLRVVFDGEARQVARGDSARAVEGRLWLWQDGALYLSAGEIGWALEVGVRMDWSEVLLQFTGTRAMPAVQRLARDARRASLMRRDAAAPPASALTIGASLADGAVIDWSLSSSTTDPVRSTVLQLGIGAQVLGGGLEIQQTVQREAFGPDATLWSWTSAWPDRPWLRQARVGDVQGSGPEPRSIYGVVVSNAPFVRSADFGTDALGGTLPPGWEAELYRGGQLVGYTPADAVRRFRLDVPVTYGPNPVDVVLYGPHGEVVRRSRTFFVPFERLPSGRFEYALGGGACRDEPCRRAGNLDLRYGLSSRVTAEAGLEYLARDTVGGRAYPYALLSAGLTPALGLTGQVVARGLLRARADFDPGPDLHLDVEHEVFDTSAVAFLAGRTVGRTRSTADAFWRPAVLGGALYFQGSFSRTAGSLTRSDLGSGTVTLVILGIRVSVGAHRNAQRLAAGATTVQSGLDGSAQAVLHGPGRLLRATFVRGEIRTECPQELVSCTHQVTRVAGTLGRQLLSFLRLDLGATWQRGWGRPSFDLGLTTALPALRAVSHNSWDPEAGVGGTQVLEGSVLWDRQRGHVDFGNGRSLGRAGIAGVVFFDANADGVQDEGEQGLANVLLRVGSRAVVTDSSGRFDVFDFVPFERAVVAVDSQSLPNPTWVPAEPLLAVRPTPNSYQLLPIAVVQGGEIGGRVLWEGHERALGGIRVVFRDQEHGAETTAATFSDGAFYVMGLRPGRYWVFVDADQLQQLGLRSEPVSVTIGAADQGQLEGVTVRLERAVR